MWAGGAPEGRNPEIGWKNSEYLMFPIIGAAHKDTIRLEGEDFPMAQHGLSRDLPWNVVLHDPDKLVMVQSYEAGEEVMNSKGFISVFPESFTITKAYAIEEDAHSGSARFVLSIDIEAGSDLIYGIGWHPGWRNIDGGIIVLPSTNSAFAESNVREAEGNAMMLSGVKGVEYKNSEFELEMVHDFGNTLLWDRGEGLVAIEPVSAMAVRRIPGSQGKDLGELEGYTRLVRGEIKTFTAIISIRT